MRCVDELGGVLIVYAQPRLGWTGICVKNGLFDRRERT